ncbi:MAG TPA: hypothetical protein VM619_16310 [Luteimonas sp.]|nr:hypothetical protein [Luteimonas sp.]
MSALGEAREDLERQARELAIRVESNMMSLYRGGNIRDEESLSGALCSQLRSDRSGIIDVSIVHKQIEEPKIGADLLIAFRCTDTEWPIRSRLLVQAKRAEPDVRMATRDWDFMQDQVRKMLDIAVESFIMAYSRECGIVVFPAIAVAACRSRDLFDLRQYAFPDFVDSIFCGRIGQEPAGGSIATYGDDAWGARYELQIVASMFRPEPEVAPRMQVG